MASMTNMEPYYTKHQADFKLTVLQTGANGADGAKGADGADGAKGDPGGKGDPGSNGSPGGKGDPGTNGSPGSKGDAGASGVSTDSVTLTGTTLATKIGIGTGSALVEAGPKATTPTSVGIHLGVDSGTTAGIELCSALLQSLSYIDFTYVGADYKGRILYDTGASSMTF